MDMVIEHSKSFSIYQANGKRKEGLKKAFVMRKALFGLETQVILNDGSKWPLFFETNVNAICNITQYIISFQVYKNGDYFAVARLYKDKDKQ